MFPDSVEPLLPCSGPSSLPFSRPGGPQKQILTPYPRKTPLFGHSSLSWKFLLSVPPSSLPSLFLPAWWRPTLTWQFPSKKQIHVVSLSDWHPGYPFLYQKNMKTCPRSGLLLPVWETHSQVQNTCPCSGLSLPLKESNSCFPAPKLRWM